MGWCFFPLGLAQFIVHRDLTGKIPIMANEQPSQLAVEESNNLVQTDVNGHHNPNHATLHQAGTQAVHNDHTSRFDSHHVRGEHATCHDFLCHSLLSTSRVWDLLLSCIPASFTRRGSVTTGNGPERRPRPTRRLTKTRRREDIQLNTLSDPSHSYEAPNAASPRRKRNRLRSHRRPISTVSTGQGSHSGDLQQSTHSNIPTRMTTGSTIDPRHRSSSRNSHLQGNNSAFLNSLRAAPRPPLVPFPLHLPDDILRCIFENAAYDDIDTACSLVLVASHVKEWVDPILYSAVRLEGPSQIRLFARTVRESFDSQTSGTTSRPRTPIDLSSSMPHLPLPPLIPYAQPRRSISIDSLRASIHTHAHHAYVPPSPNRQRFLSDQQSPRIKKRPSFFKHVRSLALLPQEDRVLLFFRDVLRDAILIMSACVNVVELETTGDFLRRTNVARESTEIHGHHHLLTIPDPGGGGDGESVHTTTPTTTPTPTPGTSTPIPNLVPPVSLLGMEAGHDQVGGSSVLAPMITSSSLIGGDAAVNAATGTPTANLSGSSTPSNAQGQTAVYVAANQIQPWTLTDQPTVTNTTLGGQTLSLPSRLEDALLRPRYLTLVPPTLNVNFRLAILSKVTHLHYSVELPRALNVFGVGEGLLSGVGSSGVNGELTHVAFDYPLGVTGVRVETLLMLVRSALDVGKRPEHEMDDNRSNTPRPFGDDTEDERRRDERDDNQSRRSSLEEEENTTANPRGRMLEMVVVRVLLRPRPRIKQSDRTGQVWRQLADLSAQDERLVYFESAGLFGEDVWEMARASVAQRERLSASWYRESP